MPRPMSKSANEDLSKALHKASEVVAEASMTSAAKDVRSFIEKEGEEGEFWSALMALA